MKWNEMKCTIIYQTMPTSYTLLVDNFPLITRIITLDVVHVTANKIYIINAVKIAVKEIC